MSGSHFGCFWLVGCCFVCSGHFTHSLVTKYFFSLYIVVVLPGERVASATPEDHTDDHTGDGQWL